MTDGISRWAFAKTAMAAGRAAAQGANGRVRLGLFGVANRGGQLITAFLDHDDAEIVAVWGVYEPHLEKARQRVPRAKSSQTTNRRTTCCTTSIANRGN